MLAPSLLDNESIIEIKNQLLQIFFHFFAEKFGGMKKGL